MDTININTRVLLKEPRGFIRLLQVLFAILAWSTTASFTTTSIMEIACPNEFGQRNQTFYPAPYKISYPFDLRNTSVDAPKDCTEDDTDMIGQKFPIDFSATAMLYVLISVVSLLYAIAAGVYYCMFTVKYETDPLVPMVDLCITLLLTILWVILTITWGLNVSDLKHYVHPMYISNHVSICQNANVSCHVKELGKWSSLSVSIGCGFMCIMLWLGSTWYTFKETTLHKKPTYQTTTQTVQQAGM